ncbi:MAG TPA: response regulator [Candidatus Solibacter sp.]|nr:response regulator [Candidatus Solibacter sp.]
MARVVREGTTILIADDDAMLLKATSMMLHRSGYRVLTAPDGEAALRTFEKAPHPIQLVIADVMMPRMMGPQLVRSIKNRSGSTATLLMSGSRPIASDAATASIEKPFTREAFVAKVRDLLAGCDFDKIAREQSAARVSDSSEYGAGSSRG